MSELAESLLVGAYEFHTHPAPSHRDRRYDDFEYLSALDASGMAGAVVKNHFSPTSARVALANKYGNAKARLFGFPTRFTPNWSSAKWIWRRPSSGSPAMGFAFSWEAGNRWRRRNESARSA